MADAAQALGRYKLQRKIGAGAMGLVYEALDPKLNRPVAIKTILKSHLDEEVAREYSVRFREEAQAVARLNHPNIVQVYDFGEEGDVAFIVMEFIRGKDLKYCFDNNVRFEAKDFVRMMSELLSALDYAHQAGIVHRDIKPANVMLDVQSRVKLMDFGVAKIQDTDRTHRTQVGTMVGTPSYMSPEQVQGLVCDHRSDLFSCGIVLYQFLTNQRPFTGGDWTLRKAIVHDDPVRPSQLNASLSPEFDRVISRALAKTPETRYQSAADFSRALQRVYEGKPAEDEDDRTVMRPSSFVPPPRAPEPARAAPGPATSTGGGSQEVELEFWRSIKDSDDPEDYALYLQQFPHGTYAKLAERKMSKLRKADGSTASGAQVRTGSVGLADTGTSASEVEELRKLEAEHRRQAEELARRQAEARKQAEERARLEAERVRREQEEKARREAEAKAKRDAEEKARREAEERARREAEEQARLEAERLRREQEEKARREAEARAKREAEERARLEAERVRREQEEKARREAEAKAKRDAEEKARREAEERARREAEEKAKLEAERVRREQEEKARREAEAKAKREAEERARREAEENARLEAERVRREQEEKARREAEAKAKREAEERARREAEEKARKDAEEKARKEAERRRREAEARSGEDAEALVARQAEEAARREADRKWREEAEQEAEAAIAGKPAVAVPAAPRRSPFVVPAALGAVVVIGAAAAYFALRSSPEEAPQQVARPQPKMEKTEPQIAKVEPQVAKVEPQVAKVEPQPAPPAAAQPPVDEKAKREAEKAAAREAAEKAAAEKARQAKEAEERAKREKALAEQKKQDAARLAAEEQKKREAARLAAEEEKKRAEAARVAADAEKKRQAAAEAEKKRAEAARLAGEEEKRRQAEAARLAAEEAKKREAIQLAAAKQAEAAKAAEAKAAQAAKPSPADIFRRASELESEGKVSEAVKLYRSVGPTHGPSAKKLGDIYAGGKGDVRADYTESLRWHARARQLGETIPVKGR